MNYGMIATGNHRDYRFAARSTTLPQRYNYRSIEYACECNIIFLFMPSYVRYMVGGALPRPYNEVFRDFVKLPFVAQKGIVLWLRCTVWVYGSAKKGRI